jgi:hypothetical protein
MLIGFVQARNPIVRRVLQLVVYTFLAAVVTAGAYGMSSRGDWRSASREPLGLAPDPAVMKEAVVQVYGARAIGAKGLFGVHTWVAVKPSEAPEWTTYQVVGWRLGRSPSVVVTGHQRPDRRWYGAVPELYAERRGPGVDGLIQRIEQAVREYPYAAQYRVWPGPNSNTFTAWISRAVPELELDLPATAIGKDYLGSSIIGTAPSGSGVQLSFGGLLGIAVSAVDGLEVNMLGLNFGIGPGGLKLPIVGLVGTRMRPGTAEPARLPGTTDSPIQALPALR